MVVGGGESRGLRVGVLETVGDVLDEPVVGPVLGEPGGNGPVSSSPSRGNNSAKPTNATTATAARVAAPMARRRRRA